MFMLSFIRNIIVKNRLKKNLAKFQRLLSGDRTKGVLSKDETLSYVKDMLLEIFGYQKNEIISGSSIQFFDIAVKINTKIVYMIKCWPINVNLNNLWASYRPSKEEIKYCAANKVNWIVFTNGVDWQLYATSFNENGYKIESLSSFNILSVSYTNKNDIEKLAIVAKEGVKSSFHKKVLRSQRLYERAQKEPPFEVGIIVNI